MIPSKTFGQNQSHHAQNLAVKSIRAREIREQSKKILQNRRYDDSQNEKKKKVQNARSLRLAKLSGNETTRTALYAQAVRELNRKKNPATMKKVNRHPNFHPEPQIMPSRPQSPMSELSNPEEKWREEFYGSRQVLRGGESLTTIQKRKQENDVWAKIIHKNVEENKAFLQSEHQRIARTRAENALDLQNQLQHKNTRLEKEYNENQEYNQRVLADVQNYKKEMQQKAAQQARKQQEFRNAFMEDMESLQKKKMVERHQKVQFEKAEAEQARLAILEEESHQKERKKQEKTKMQAMLQENKKHLQLKAKLKQDEVKRDLKLNEEMKARMEREQRKREEYLKRISEQQEMAQKRMEPLYNAMMTKLKEQSAREDALYEAYTAQRDQQEKAKEDKRKKLAKEQEAYLLIHRAEQEKRYQKECEEEKRIAQELLRKDKQALTEDKIKRQRQRQENMKVRRDLEQQIAAKFKAQSDELLKPMNPVEEALNQKLLKKDISKRGNFPRAPI